MKFVAQVFHVRFFLSTRTDPASPTKRWSPPMATAFELEHKTSMRNQFGLTKANAHFVGFAQIISQLSRKVSASRLLRYGFSPKPPARTMSWVNGEHIVRTQRPFTYRYFVVGSKPFKNGRNYICHGRNEKCFHLFSSRRASDAASFVKR